MNDPYFITPIAQHIWDAKYRFREHGMVRDDSIQDTWLRIAQALAAQESNQRGRMDKRSVIRQWYLNEAGRQAQ